MKLTELYSKLSSMFCSVNLTPFWSDFWSNFLASIIVGIIFALLLPFYLDFIRRPKDLKFQFDESNSNTLKIKRIGEHEYEYSFQLTLMHLSGRQSFHHPIYWHLYLPRTLNVQVNQIPGSTLNFTSEVVGNTFILQGKIEGPIYINSASKLFLQISGKFRKDPTHKESKIPLYYYFNTEYGSYPDNFIKDNPSRNSAKLNSMSKLFLEMDK